MATCASRRPRGTRLPPELAHLAPLLRERSRIEALAAALIDLLDSFDAPLADMEDEPELPIRRSRCSLGAGNCEDAEPGEDDEPGADSRLVA